MVSPSDVDSERSRTLQWLLIEGDRFVVTLVQIAVVFALTLALVQGGWLAIGPSSSLPHMLGAGGLAGLLTLLTVTLSINQLTLSRMFGSPESLEETLEGTVAFRNSVERLAGEHGVTNDPGAFVSVVAAALADAVDRLGDSLPADPETADDVAAFADTVGSYAEDLSSVEESDATAAVLARLLGPAYADNLTVAHSLQRTHREGLSPTVADRLDDVVSLLEAIAVARQFFKTLVVQRDLARLSRQLLVMAPVSTLAVIYLTAAYTTHTVTIPYPYRPLAVTIVVTLLYAPLAEIVSTLLRVATVTINSVSVGPFVPPEVR